MPEKYQVRAGDCIASIAYERGFFPDTIWNHPDNAALKQQRKDPHVLHEGDQVSILDKRIVDIDKPAEKRHRFRRKSVPEKFKLILSLSGKPRAHLAYTLVVEGVHLSGETNEDGLLEHYISPEARHGKLVISEDEEYEILFGGLDPIDTDTGVADRLVNLGFLERRDADDKIAVREAIESFQTAKGLETTGTLDKTTTDKLKDAHGS